MNREDRRVHRLRATAQEASAIYIYVYILELVSALSWHFSLISILFFCP